MWRYIVRRLAQTVPVLLGVSVLAFAIMHVVPGDPVMMMMAQNSAATPEQIANMRHQLGLDLPLWQQYLHYMGDRKSTRLNSSHRT